MSLFQPRTIDVFDRGIVPIINDNFKKLWRMLTGGVDYSNVAAAGLLQTWQDSAEDNMDDSNDMTIEIYLPAETKQIHKALLRLRKKQYRADSTGSASGGGATTGANGIHYHTMSTWEAETTNGPPDHEHNYYAPTAQTGSCTDHTHSTSSHTHSINYGINLLTLPSNAGYTVTVNGTDRTTALGGPWTGNVDELDLTPYMVIGQWNTIDIGCGTGVEVRTRAQMFIQAFIEPIGRLYAEE